MKSHFFIALAMLALLQACCRECGEQPCPDPCAACPHPDPNCVIDDMEPGLSSTVDIQTPIDSVKPSAADIGIYRERTYVDMSNELEYTLHAYIHNASGNNCSDQGNTKAVIMLPQNVVVTRVHAVDTLGRALSYRQCKAYIEVDLSWLCPKKETMAFAKGDSIVVTVSRSAFPHPACQAAFGILVYSGMPDPVPSNNSWWWRRTCPQDEKSFEPSDPIVGP